MGQLCENSMYIILEITWDDYALYYILKYIPTYVRMDWLIKTTHQTHTNDPKFFHQSFCGHHPYPYLQLPCFWWYWAHYKKSFIFSVDCMQITCWSYDTTETTEKFLCGHKFLPNFFCIILMNANPTISSNFVEIGGLLFFAHFPWHLSCKLLRNYGVISKLLQMWHSTITLLFFCFAWGYWEGM
jgi:hypothetical protein